MNEIKINNINGVLTVSSLQIAKDFEKRHDHVVRNIENIINMINRGVPKIGETPEKGLKSNISNYFIETTYQNFQNKQCYKCYDITRDGFSLLVMGFTGDKAFNWKIKYIEAFNIMERQLTNINANIEETVNNVLNRKIEEIVNIAVENAVSETVKVLAPYIQISETPEHTQNRISCHHRNFQNGKIASLPHGIRCQVDEMIISKKYSCQKIADFITANTGISLSYMTVNRYIKKYFKN